MNNEPVAWLWTKDGKPQSALLHEPMTVPSDPYWKDKGFKAIPLYTHPAKTLTNAVVNELWAESQEDGIAMQQGFTTQQHYFAYLILRKASEK